MTARYDEGFAEHYYSSADGLRLYARIYGADNAGTPVLCLPGLSRNSRDFHQFARSLSNRRGAARRVVCLDLRGRGRSEYDVEASRYNIGVEAADVLAACEALGIEQADFVGTSRGGLIMHVLAGTAPELLGKLVLNDIGPEIALEGLRQIQHYLGQPQRALEDWDDAVMALKQTHGAHFPALSEADWRELADAIYRDVDGRVVADFDPAIAAQLAAADLSQPLPDLWAQFDQFGDRPLMVIRGEHSQLLTAETAARMAERHGSAEVAVAAGQGHAPILHLSGLDNRIGAFLSED